MENKVVVITGAGSGLGASLAKQFANSGNHICLLGRRKEKLERTANQLNSRYSIYEVDVSSKEDVGRVFRKIEEELSAIDVLVNNAGVGAFDLAEHIEEESIHQMIDINLKGTIFCTQEVLAGMKQRNKGTIVNIVSTAGQEGKVTESVYCASKFGVRGFTESLVRELNDTPIRVLAAYMGGMESEFWDGIFTPEQTKGLMKTDDVAEIIIDSIKPRKYLAVTDITIKNKKQF
ncbi:SDR family oxidoreductase [Bacillus sp. FJAT-50079]|uniref:SDR family oxidoreductase n=1 Tax=Bacillus sp. FJAT-50079 TaxID=2833577 RepID=UPI001BC8F63D|nr:SDR family oxidoreductase [Bacillus sp. FJAT-50079]MBS4210405.1 SDR family oxidoreductase [Bacillus sp. FJAT-50079]